MTRRMSDETFRREQRENLYAPHVKPLNNLVDSLGLRHGQWMPHIAPVHGGVNARVMWLARDPGPKTADPENRNRGFLCVENDDPTAERVCGLLHRAGIEVSDTMAWNAYPWYINDQPSSDEIRAGLEPLRRVIELLDRLEVLILLGNTAQRSWSRFSESYPHHTVGFDVLPTRHTSPQAFVGSTKQRAVWKEEQAQVFIEAGRILRTTG